MNERIRELSDIAYKNHLARNPHSSFGRRSDYDREFAELIVQECIGIVEKNESEIHYDTGMYPAYPTDTVRESLEHFGVD